MTTYVRRAVRGFAVLAAALGVIVGLNVALRQAAGAAPGSLDDLTEAAGALLAAGCCALAGARADGRLRLAWWALAAYAVLWWAGHVLWIAHDALTGNRQTPLPWWVDTLFLGATVFAAGAALLFQSRIGRALGWLRTLLDGLVIGAAMTSIGWSTTIGPVIDEGRFDNLQKAALVAHPAVDIVVLTLLVAAVVRPLRTPRTSVRPAVILLAGAFVVLFAADSAYSFLRARGGIEAGTAVNLAWALGFVIVALAALTHTVADLADRRAPPREESSAVGFLLPAITVVVSCGVTAWRFGETGSIGVVDLSSLLALVLLASTRQVVAIVDNQDLAERLAKQASSDPLTGVLNRRAFTAALRLALEEEPHGVAVLFLDVDGFKAVNDTYGHLAGDALLTTVARRIVTSVRPSDVVARLGGDEFGVIVAGADVEVAAVHTAERVRARLREPMALGTVELKVSASVGVALSEAGGVPPDALLQRADVAMYRAKVRGRNRVEVFDIDVHRGVVGRLRVESEISMALERRQFVLHFQPIVDLATRRVAGVEALLRWQHPQRGLLRADDFVPVAEETGLIVDLGRWVLFEACRLAAPWQGGPRSTFFLSVNVSPRQLHEPRLRRDVMEALSQHGLEPGALILEVTESSIMDDTGSAHDTLRQLREAGVRIAIDDFGSGYSSLSKLARPQADVIKTDGLFVRADPTSAAALISPAILALGRALGMELVAEGIETETQARETERVGYHLGQGFHLARPDTAERLRALGLLPASAGVPPRRE